MWVKFRHKVVCFLLRGPFTLFLKLRYNIKITKFKDKSKPYLILANHCCTMDPFFIGVMMKTPVYYMASRDLFNKGFISKVIKYLVAPIPKSKSVKDMQSIKDCLRVKKEGGNICIFPEGNRTYSGSLCFIDKSIAKLIKKLNIDVLLVNIEGGFQTDPRFSDFIRKGEMRVGVKKQLSIDDINSLSEDELFKTVVNYLDTPLITNRVYKSKKKAMYLERVMYYCFECNKYETFESKGNYITCKNCGYKLEYLENTTFKVIKGKKVFKSLDEYYNKQISLIKGLTLDMVTSLKFTDEEVQLYSIKANELRKELCQGTLKLEANKLMIKEYMIDLDQIESATCVGKNKLNIYTDEKTFQLKGSKLFSALKYMHIIYHYKHLITKKTINEEDEFLGL